jgi:hypothetical protein
MRKPTEFYNIRVKWKNVKPSSAYYGCANAKLDREGQEYVKKHRNHVSNAKLAGCSHMMPEAPNRSLTPEAYLTWAASAPAHSKYPKIYILHFLQISYSH